MPFIVGVRYPGLRHRSLVCILYTNAEAFKKSGRSGDAELRRNRLRL